MRFLPGFSIVSIVAAAALPVSLPAAPFIRGDADGSGGVDLTDPIVLLDHLFLGGPAPGCAEAADADDDGHIDITDAVSLLFYLFFAGGPPPDPFPSCGEDPSPDALGCAAYAPCEARTAMAVETPAGIAAGRIPVRYRLDAAEPFDLVAVEYSLAGPGGPWREATEAAGRPSEGKVGLAPVGPGESHLFVWNAPFDLDVDLRAGRLAVPATARAIVRLAARPGGSGSTIEGRTAEFHLDGRIVTTFAGGDIGDGRPAAEAAVFPRSIAVDRDGNLVIADPVHQRVRRIDRQTGTISTVAGTGTASFGGDGGPAALAGLDEPSAVAVGPAGDILISDTYNNRIRRVNAGRTIATLIGPDGLPLSIMPLIHPRAIASDLSGRVFIADDGSSRILRFGSRAGDVAVLIQTMSFHSFLGIAVDAAGNVCFSESDLDQVLLLDPVAGTTRVVAGAGHGFSGDGGKATDARLDGPTGLALSPAGDLFIADTRNRRIRKVTAATGIIETVAGNGGDVPAGDGGPAVDAALGEPGALAVDGAGGLLIGDERHGTIRRVDLATGIISGAAGSTGDGLPATAMELEGPAGIAVDGSGNAYIPEYDRGLLRRIDGRTGIASTVPIALPAGETAPGPPTAVAIDEGGDIYVAACGGVVLRIDPATKAAVRIAAGVGEPGGIAVAPGFLFIADTTSNTVRRVDLGSGTIDTIAGKTDGSCPDDGGPAPGCLSVPLGLAVGTDGAVYIAEFDGCRVLRVDPATGRPERIAGQFRVAESSGDGGPAAFAHLESPAWLAFGRAGDLLIGEANRIRRVDLRTGIIDTVSDVGGAVGMDAVGNVYAAERGRVLRFWLGTGE